MKPEPITIPVKVEFTGEAASLLFEDETLAGPPQLVFVDDIEDFHMHIESAVVTNDVAGVLLRVFHNGESWLVEGSSKRDPRDKPDYNTAYLIAMSRALESVTRQFIRQGEGRIKNNEWIRKEHKKAQKKAARAEKAKAALGWTDPNKAKK